MLKLGRNNGQRTIILPIGLVTLVILLIAVNSIMSFKKEIPVNLTSDIQLQFEGENGSGTATVIKDIKYDGLSQTVKRFIDSVSYTVIPSENLSNGDIVTVTAHYDEELRKLGSIAVEDPKREFTADNLLAVKVSTDSQVIHADGYPVPDSMAGSEKDRRLYAEYMKSLENSNSEEYPVPDLWIQGENPEADYRSDKTFLISDCTDYNNDAYDRANEYGCSSSQEYMVKPLVENEQVTGWTTVFR